MSTELLLRLDVPPGLNNSYMTIRGKRVLSPAARAYKEDARIKVRQDAVDNGWPMNIDPLKDTRCFGLEIVPFFSSEYIYHRRDLDGCIKLVQDAICEELGIDDCRIDDVHVTRPKDGNRAFDPPWDDHAPHLHVRFYVLDHRPVWIPLEVQRWRKKLKDDTLTLLDLIAMGYIAPPKTKAEKAKERKKKAADTGTPKASKRSAATSTARKASKSATSTSLKARSSSKNRNRVKGHTANDVR